MRRLEHITFCAVPAPQHGDRCHPQRLRVVATHPRPGPRPPHDRYGAQDVRHVRRQVHWSGNQITFESPRTNKILVCCVQSSAKRSTPVLFKIPAEELMEVTHHQSPEQFHMECYEKLHAVLCRQLGLARSDHHARSDPEAEAHPARTFSLWASGHHTVSNIQLNLFQAIK